MSDAPDFATSSIPEKVKIIATNSSPQRLADVCKNAEKVVAMVNTIDDTLAQRGSQYGKFIDQSKISEAIKAVMHAGPSWGDMASDQREAMDMIAVKIARLLNGNPNHIDSWVDISGYSMLISKRLTGETV